MLSSVCRVIKCCDVQEGDLDVACDREMNMRRLDCIQSTSSAHAKGHPDGQAWTYSAGLSYTEPH